MTDQANIAKALCAAQAEMGKAIKGANNPAFRSKYADLGAVMDACLPALNAHGIALMQMTATDAHGKMCVATVFLHESGERIYCETPVIVGKNDMQGYGSAVTYARRYGLMAMAGIAPEDDDGNAAVKGGSAADAPRRANAPDPVAAAVQNIRAAVSMDALAAAWKAIPASVRNVPEVLAAKDAAKASFEEPPAPDAYDAPSY